MEREKTEEIKSTNPINQDEIQIYLKDIRKIKVMTPEREKFLAERISSNDCTEREKELIQKEMLEGNLRFVITVAKQYQNQGIDLSDLIAEGNFGLMKAIKNLIGPKKIDLFLMLFGGLNNQYFNHLMITQEQFDYQLMLSKTCKKKKS